MGRGRRERGGEVRFGVLWSGGIGCQRGMTISLPCLSPQRLGSDTCAFTLDTHPGLQNNHTGNTQYGVQVATSTSTWLLSTMSTIPLSCRC